MGRFQRKETESFACVQIEKRSLLAEIGRSNEQKLATLSGDERGMSWLPAEKHPELSLARQVEGRLWRVQNGML